MAHDQERGSMSPDIAYLVDTVIAVFFRKMSEAAPPVACRVLRE